MDTDGEQITFYVKQISAEVLEKFPKLDRDGLESFLQDAAEECAEDAMSYEPPDAIDLDEIDIPERPDDTVVRFLIRLLKDASPSFDGSAWMARCVPGGDNTDLVNELLEEIERFNASQAERMREEYARSRIGAAAEAASAALEAILEVEPGCQFLMWGNSPAEFTSFERYDLKKYAPVFRDSRKVREFTDLLGRKDDESEDAKGTISGFDGGVRDDMFGTEIMGIRIGSDIANLVPSELVPLMDEDLSMVFDMKFIEDRLMEFNREDEFRVDEDENGEKRMPDKQGPVILVVDTSGSMYGSPLFYEKALIFTIVTRAAEQGRDVFRIDFNTVSRSVDMSPKTAFKELMSFLHTDANGGTDPGPAMREAVETIEREEYSFADVVVISDFFLDMGIFERRNPVMESLRERGCRVHSVSIPPSPAMAIDDFDSCWGLSKINGKFVSGTFDRIDEAWLTKMRAVKRRSRRDRR